MSFNRNEVYAKYACFAIVCGILTVPYCGIFGFAGICVALVYLRCYVNRLP